MKMPLKILMVHAFTPVQNIRQIDVCLLFNDIAIYIIIIKTHFS